VDWEADSEVDLVAADWEVDLVADSEVDWEVDWEVDSEAADSEADSEAPHTCHLSSLVHTHTANLYH